MRHVTVLFGLSSLVASLAACDMQDLAENADSDATLATGDTAGPSDQPALRGTLTVPVGSEIPPDARLRVGLIGNASGALPAFDTTLASTDVATPAPGSGIEFAVTLPTTMGTGEYTPYDGGQERALLLVGAWIERGGTEGFDLGVDTAIAASPTMLSNMRPSGDDAEASEPNDSSWYTESWDWNTGTATDEVHALADSDGFALDANLLPLTRSALPVEVVPALGRGTYVGLRSVVQWWGASEPADPTLASLATDLPDPGVGLALPAPFPTPPAAHRQYDDYWQVTRAYYVAVAWSDADGDALCSGDEWRDGADSAITPDGRYVVWTEPAGFRALLLRAASQEMGWSIVDKDFGTPVDWDEGVVLDR